MQNNLLFAKWQIEQAFAIKGLVHRTHLEWRKSIIVIQCNLIIISGKLRSFKISFRIYNNIIIYLFRILTQSAHTCVLQHLLIHTRSATNQLSPNYIHDKSAERKAICFLNICLYSNEYMPICVYIIHLASKQQCVWDSVYICR